MLPRRFYTAATLYVLFSGVSLAQSPSQRPRPYGAVAARTVSGRGANVGDGTHLAVPWKLLRRVAGRKAVLARPPVVGRHRSALGCGSRCHQCDPLVRRGEGLPAYVRSPLWS